MHRLYSPALRGQIFCLVVVSIALFTLSGCGSGSVSGAINPTPTPTPSVSPTPTPTPGTTPTPSPTPTPTPSSGVANDQTLKTEDVATGLDNPWSLVFAPDGRLFFTEPPGRLRVITNTGLVAQPVLDIS